jgi:hypothetical protein
MTTRTARYALLTTLAAGALVLSACGGSSSSGSSESPIGGGSASCDQATLESLSQQAATDSGSTWVSFKSVECLDGWALVFGITKTGDIEQTTAFVYEAEGPNWALKQQDVICGDGGDDDGIPASLKDQLCALR